MRLFGHPMHPILVCFPLAFLAVAPLCDALSWLGVAGDLTRVAYYLELFGLIGGGLALVTGFADFLRLKAPSAALTKAALTHAALAITMLSLFVLAWVLRGEMRAGLPALASELVGAAVLGVTGWFGGHLVFGFGVGVAPRAKTSDDPRGR
jgi:uncharacterized membrane protein